VSGIRLDTLIDEEAAAAHAAMDAKERSLDEHGYGGKQPVDPSQIVGLEGYIPALRLYSDELGALRKFRDTAAWLEPYAGSADLESHFPDLHEVVVRLVELRKALP
jgi:hypothetical protein